MGPPLLDDPIITIPAAIAAALVAYSIIYRRGIVPLVHFFRSIDRIAEATPVLVEIAEEFRPNGGGSLRDVVDRIESKVDDAVIVAETTKTSVEGKLDEHLALPAWHDERDSVLEKLTLLDERQRGLLDSMAKILNTDAPLSTLIEQIRGVIAGEKPTT